MPPSTITSSSCPELNKKVLYSLSTFSLGLSELHYCNQSIYFIHSLKVWSTDLVASRVIIYLLVTIFSIFLLSFARCVRSHWDWEKALYFPFHLLSNSFKLLVSRCINGGRNWKLSAFDLSDLSWKSLLDKLDLFVVERFSCTLDNSFFESSWEAEFFLRLAQLLWMLSCSSDRFSKTKWVCSGVALLFISWYVFSKVWFRCLSMSEFDCIVYCLCILNGMDIVSLLISVSSQLTNHCSNCFWNLLWKWFRYTIAANQQAKHEKPIISQDSFTLQTGHIVTWGVSLQNIRQEHVWQRLQLPKDFRQMFSRLHLHWKAVICHICFLSISVIDVSARLLSILLLIAIPMMLQKYDHLSYKCSVWAGVEEVYEHFSNQ